MLKNGEQLVYSSSKENKEKGESPIHTIDLFHDGKIIGRAEITYYSKPFPLYQISDLYVDYEFQGEGRGSEIMSQVESFLNERKRAGVLVEAIDPDSPASGMYQRRGWLEVPGQHGLHVYNLPKSAKLEDLNGYASRFTFMEERESWKNKIIASNE